MVEEKQISVTWPVRGMTCAACASSVESSLNAVPGVQHASVNFATNSVRVSYDPDVIKPEDLKKAVIDIGYDLLISPETTPERPVLKYKVYTALAFSVPVFLISMVFHDMPYGNWTMLILSLPVILWAGKDFFTSAWKKLMHRQTNMDTLVALGTGSAFLFSLLNTFSPEFLASRGFAPHVYYEVADIVIALILFGRYIEERAKGRTTKAIKALIQLQPAKAVIIKDGNEVEIPADALQPGHEFVVRPGDRLPADGIVLDGESLIQESMITGEPLASEKNIGSRVIAGTINETGFLRVRAEKTGSDTSLSKIIQIVEDAQGSKIPIQQFADKVASVFVPFVLLIAVLTFVAWSFFGPDPALTYALVTTITVLIIACPCALGLATPTAIVVGIGKGAEKGILIRNGSALETLEKIQVLIVDKTGTLTEGKPTVVGAFWVPDPGSERDELARIIAELESRSTHPLAGAVTEFLKKNPEDQVEIEHFRNITGKGILGTVGGEAFLAGSLQFMQEFSIEIPEDLEKGSKRLQEQGMSVVLCARDKRAFVVLGIKDPLRKEAKSAIEQLKLRGIEVVMATGDNKAAAETIAAEAGIHIVHAQLLPEEKGDIVRKYQQQGKKVAMAGDGINDAPALALADVGISLSGGTDIAIESSGVTLLHGDISKIVSAIHLSSYTLKTIRENLFWAFIYNVIAIPVAAGALFPFYGFLLNPMIAGGAMAFSSVSVVLNSLRLRYRR